MRRYLKRSLGGSNHTISLDQALRSSTSVVSQKLQPYWVDWLDKLSNSSQQHFSFSNYSK
jgi:hypothetical protein